LAWFLFQQGLSAAMRSNCHLGAPPLGTVWGIFSLLLCALSGASARPATWPSSLEANRMPRFLAYLAVIGAGFFALAIAFQTLATLIVPPCIR
jgi:hypothetical protein